MSRQQGTHPGGGLEVTGLTAAYDKLEVLHGVDVSVAPAELVAVIGSNGAGKTTLLRAVSGLIRPTGGTVLLGGEEVTTMGAEQIAARGMAHVPENRLVFPSLTVDDNLELGGWTRRGDGRHAQRRAEALELFPRLADRITLPAGALSGGEQQMLAMARALMAEPSVVVLDEPSLGLAPKVVGEIIAALGALRDSKRLAVLLIEQNIRAAFTVADRVVVMERGTVVAQGTPADLSSDDRVRKAYLGGGSTSSGSVAARSTSAPSPASPAPGSPAPPALPTPQEDQ
ncbi:ABC transporter ATP-binding protein [Knoellia sp. 3-2P3]|uniref:ABC transporter ATP-binding protein n=1 Tax=unclassified Knoellia TaxID=2618719 RepID=UPI0023DC6E4F|nr:ABC transporter ATP-binding protein [Knoellia sp. 3-2P3]MDF2092504.1 ABC transporter ATP-binding protein [Knoellia sp. 3-2P3]